MPYGGTADLPSSIRDALPLPAQEIYLGAYNGAEDTCKDQPDPEACAAKIAWSAVTKAGYRKGEDGAWKKNNRLYRSGPFPVARHDAILHLLDRTVGDAFFPVEPFEKSLNQWASIPLIFAQNHIDFTCALPAHEDKNLQKYLDTVRGAIVGENADPRIDRTGHPKLITTFLFTEDTAQRLFDAGTIDAATLDASKAAIPVCQRLLEEGKLSLSSAFCAPNDADGALTGVVRPNHVLLFEETEADQPRDKGAVILNREISMPDKKIENIGRVISGTNRSKFKQALDSLWTLFKEMAGEEKENRIAGDEGAEVNGPDAAIPEALPQLNASDTMTETEHRHQDGAAGDDVAALKEEIAALKEENAALKEEIAALKKEITDAKQAQKDAAWEQLKNKLPPGLVHGEKEKETRQLFESDPLAFTNKLLDLKTAPPTKEEGEQYANQGENDPVAIARELRQSTGRMR